MRKLTFLLSIIFVLIFQSVVFAQSPILCGPTAVNRGDLVNPNWYDDYLLSDFVNGVDYQVFDGSVSLSGVFPFSNADSVRFGFPSDGAYVTISRSSYASPHALYYNTLSYTSTASAGLWAIGGGSHQTFGVAPNHDVYGLVWNTSSTTLWDVSLSRPCVQNLPTPTPVPTSTPVPPPVCSSNYTQFDITQSSFDYPYSGGFTYADIYAYGVQPLGGNLLGKTIVSGDSSYFSVPVNTLSGGVLRYDGSSFDLIRVCMLNVGAVATPTGQATATAQYATSTPVPVSTSTPVPVPTSQFSGGGTVDGNLSLDAIGIFQMLVGFLDMLGILGLFRGVIGAIFVILAFMFVVKLLR